MSARGGLVIDGQSLTIEDVVRFARVPETRVELEPAARDRLRASRAVIERAIARGDTIYGINTGFGKLANVRIAARSAGRSSRPI